MFNSGGADASDLAIQLSKYPPVVMDGAVISHYVDVLLLLAGLDVLE